MRIAFVYDAIYPYILGGVEKRVWEIARRLVARGHEVHLFGMKFWEGEQIISREGVFIHGICRPYRFYHKGKRRILPAFFYGLNVFFALLKERFDVVDCQQFPYTSVFGSAAACRISKSPLIITWHEVWGDYWYEYLGQKGSGGKMLERLAARINTNTVAVSETTKKGLIPLVNGRDIRIITNGIDLAEIDAIQPSETRSDILFVGRLIREKHVDVLVDAVGILRETWPGIRCLVIGDGPERMVLEEKVDVMDLSANILFTGFFKQYSEVIAHMKSSRVFVLPSTREGFGISALEALAAGLPVVTVDHPKNASTVFARVGDGALAALDARDVAEKIQMVLDWKDAGRSARGAIIAHEYDWNIITDQIEAYYSGIHAVWGHDIAGEIKSNPEYI